MCLLTVFSFYPKFFPVNRPQSTLRIVIGKGETFSKIAYAINAYIYGQILFSVLRILYARRLKHT